MVSLNLKGGQLVGAYSYRQHPAESRPEHALNGLDRLWPMGAKNDNVRRSTPGLLLLVTDHRCS